MLYEPNHDRVELLESLPESSVGAPLPRVLADESVVVLAYRCEQRDPEWTERRSAAWRQETDEEAIALVRFSGAVAHYLGQPNDEAFTGHPLAWRGLRRYRVHRIQSPSWVNGLERMNSVHPNHDATRFAELQHLLFAFHESTFECVCRTFEHETTIVSLESVVARMTELVKS